MDVTSFVDALRRDSAGLLAAARAADPERRVPSCPDWTPADLVWHVVVVHGFWAWCVREQAQDPDGRPRLERPAGDDELYAMAAATAAQLADLLATSDPSTPVWTWAGGGDVAWVARRVAHETAVHRHDAEEAAEHRYEIDPELASDGIDEYLHVFVPRRPAEHELTGSVHLHCTDVAGEWLVEPAAAGEAPTIRREHAKGDAAVRGPAEDLLLVLWGRRPLESADVIGDAAVAAQLIAG